MPYIHSHSSGNNQAWWQAEHHTVSKAYWEGLIFLQLLLRVITICFKMANEASLRKQSKCTNFAEKPLNILTCKFTPESTKCY